MSDGVSDENRLLSRDSPPKIDCVPNFAYSIARFSRFGYTHFVKISAQNDLVKGWFDYISSDAGKDVIKSVGLIIPQ